MADDVDRTEEPTARRLDEARREGQVAVSQEAFAVAGLLAIALFLQQIGPRALADATSLFHDAIRFPEELTAVTAAELFLRAFAHAAGVMIPLLALGALAALAIGFLQTRFALATRKLKPKLSRLSPQQNFGRVFKRSAPIEAPKALAKLALAGGALWLSLRAHVGELRGLDQIPVALAAAFQLGLVLKALIAASALLALIALADWLYQWRKLQTSLRMTRTEVRDEMKQSQGDPQVRRRVLGRMMQRAYARLAAVVPTADVVVTNPEHYSVALKYDRREMAAPLVVAKGAGFIALRIRELAHEAGVPVVPNPPIARSLYRSVRVGKPVPEQLYQAVAEILAYVYRLDRRKGAAW